MVAQFQKFLEKNELSDNTVTSYMWTVNNFFLFYGNINKNNLLAYKTWLIENFKPGTVNSRLQALNKFLEFTSKNNLKMRFVKVHNRNYLENVISDADYRFFKTQLKKDGLLDWYFIVWFLTATGARISELLQIKVEHVKSGHLDIYTKSGTIRRLHIPKTLRENAIYWLSREKKFHGYVFQNCNGERLNGRSISRELKFYARQYGLNTKVVYPHSFRHRFAKNFLDKFNDIALLADLMGHKSIETTRIYLRRTASEQQTIVDSVITW
ncbi:MAG: tyrosine-type recombinase/integrase [Prevotellaceae bacterium]|jgi:site-specific recombinase XerD|nr:tyrosine-type recombinase/integrase [Prevotellaceae bacterium]